MGAQLGGSGAMSEINMTPLIDIVLVVLIIMMVNIPIQVEQMGVKLPNLVDEPPPPPEEPVEQLVVAMYENGDIGLNKCLMPEEGMFAEITRRLRPMDKKVVFIDAHPLRLWTDVVDMVDLAKEAGAEKVSFAKLKETGPAAASCVKDGALERGVYPGSPGTAGSMTEKAADDQFKPMLPQVEACYNAALALAPTLSGRLVLRVDVGPEGEIMETEIVSNTTEDAGLEQCILERVQTLTYEPLGYPNTARIHYPLLFSPG